MEEKEELKTDFLLSDMFQGNFKGELSIKDHLIQFVYILITVFAFTFLLTCNFIAMSASLNINKDNKSSIKYIYALVTFLFGFMYIVGYLMFFKIGQRNEKIEFSKDKLFPV